MRKTDKKIDNAIIEALTEVCESALKQYSGFLWLSHLVNYTNFPRSLQVICVFDSEEYLIQFNAHPNQRELRTLIKQRLSEIGVAINDKQVTFVTKDQCRKYH